MKNLITFEVSSQHIATVQLTAKNLTNLCALHGWQLLNSAPGSAFARELFDGIEKDILITWDITALTDDDEQPHEPKRHSLQSFFTPKQYTYLVKLNSPCPKYAVSGGHYFGFHEDPEKATRFNSATAASIFIAHRKLEGVAEVLCRLQSGKLAPL